MVSAFQKFQQSNLLITYQLTDHLALKEFRVHFTAMWTEMLCSSAQIVLHCFQFLDVFCLMILKLSSEGRKWVTNHYKLSTLFILNLWISLDTYWPSTQVSVGDCLATLRGNCPFRVYINIKFGHYFKKYVFVQI